MPRAYLREYDPEDELERGFIVFAGLAVNLNRMAVQESLDYSYLFRIFRGERPPSLAYAKKIAAHLKMSYAEFLTKLDDHTRENQE